MNFKDLQIRRFLAIKFSALKKHFRVSFQARIPANRVQNLIQLIVPLLLVSSIHYQSEKFFRICRTRFWMELLNTYTVKYWTASSSILFKISLMRNMTFSSWPIKHILCRSAVMILRSYSYIYRHDILNIFSDVKNRFPMVQFGKTFGPANLISKRRYKMLFQRRGWPK